LVILGFATAENAVVTKSQPVQNTRSLWEIMNAPWSDSDEHDHLVTQAHESLFNDESTRLHKGKASFAVPIHLNVYQTSISLFRSTSPDGEARIPYGASCEISASRSESHMSFFGSNEIFFDQQARDSTSVADKSDASQASTRSDNAFSATPSPELERTGDDADWSEEGVLIDDALLNLFNCWNLLDYEQYSWRIEIGLTAETGLHNTRLMDETFRQATAFRLLPPAQSVSGSLCNEEANTVRSTSYSKPGSANPW
jgi:hypothetical protein